LTREEKKKRKGKNAVRAVTKGGLNMLIMRPVSTSETGKSEPTGAETKSGKGGLIIRNIGN